MTAPSWFDDEIRMTACFRQVGGLFARGLRRPMLLAAVVAAYALVLSASVMWSKASYAPGYVLRIIESDRDPTGMPRPRRQLAEYVQKAVFTSAPLLELMQKHGLYPGLSRKNPRVALESFREDIEVDVYRNYFIEERALGTAPRSARLKVSYHHADPDVATAVTRDLGELLVRRESLARRDQAARAAGRAKVEVDEARAAIASRRSEIAVEKDGIAAEATPKPGRLVRLIGLVGSLPALELREDERERREATLSLGAAFERRGIGMSFEVVDDAELSVSARDGSQKRWIASASFVLGIPLLALAVGAFAPRKEKA